MTRVLEQLFRGEENAVRVAIEETAHVQASRYSDGRIALGEGVVRWRSREQPECGEGDWPRWGYFGLDVGD